MEFVAGLDATLFEGVVVSSFGDLLLTMITVLGEFSL